MIGKNPTKKLTVGLIHNHKREFYLTKMPASMMTGTELSRATSLKASLETFSISIN